MSSIVLDAPPFSTRPNILLGQIFAELKLDIVIPEASSCSFGSWTFDFNDNYTRNILKQNEENIINLIKQYYNNGRIRYAEWIF